MYPGPSSKSRQIVILVVAGIAILGLIALVLYLSNETAGSKAARLRVFAATLPAFAGKAVLPATVTTGSCNEVSDAANLPALVSRRPADSAVSLSAQSDFIGATSGRGFSWQGTSDYAYAVVTDKNKTYEITFPSDDDTSVAIMITACD